MADKDFHYFSSVEGRAVKRFGTDSWIGCKLRRDPNTGKVLGFEWDTSKIARVPVAEVKKRKRDYLEAVKEGSLIEHDGPEGTPATAPDDTESGEEGSDAESPAPLDDGLEKGSEPEEATPAPKKRRRSRRN